MPENIKMSSTFKKIKTKLKPYYKPIYQPVRKFIDSITCTQADTHWVRFVMNQETLKLITKLDPATLDVLEISGDHWGRKLSFKSYRTLNFPDFDICESVTSEKYDLIIAEQVFEHLIWPYRAGKNIFEMLNPHGYFLITVPFLVRYHGEPVDCTRWTETGIKYFLAECGFPLGSVVTGSWGNKACVKGNFNKWTRYRPWQHSLVNDPAFPVSVWALAKK